MWRKVLVEILARAMMPHSVRALAIVEVNGTMRFMWWTLGTPATMLVAIRTMRMGHSKRARRSTDTLTRRVTMLAKVTNILPCRTMDSVRVTTSIASVGIGILMRSVAVLVSLLTAAMNRTAIPKKDAIVVASRAMLFTGHLFGLKDSLDVRRPVFDG